MVDTFINYFFNHKSRYYISCTISNDLKNLAEVQHKMLVQSHMLRFSPCSVNDANL